MSQDVLLVTNTFTKFEKTYWLHPWPIKVGRTFWRRNRYFWDTSRIYWDLNPHQRALPSIQVCVIKEESAIVHTEFKWRVGIHFRQNAAKNNDLLKKGFQQKLFGIIFSTKNSVNACLYLPPEWS